MIKKMAMDIICLPNLLSVYFFTLFSSKNYKIWLQVGVATIKLSNPIPNTRPLMNMETAFLDEICLILSNFDCPIWKLRSIISP